MAAKVKACTNASYRKRNAVIIIIFALLSCAGLVMAIYNLIKANFLFAIACVIATILAVTYAMIRFNTVFATSVSLNNGNLYMKNWDNDFLPYDYDNKLKILSEFIPAKTKIIEIPVSDITAIIIGTKNFIKRSISPEMEFVESLKKIEKSKDFYRKRTVSAMDILYVETYDKECYYMPVVKFNSREVMKIVQLIQRRNPDVVFAAGSRDYRIVRAARKKS